MVKGLTLFWAARVFIVWSWVLRSRGGLIAICILVAGGFGSSVFAEVGKGAAALLEPEIAARLQLTEAQSEQIQTINRATSKKYKETLNSGQGRPGLKAELERIREEGQQQAVELLKPHQKRIWNQLSNTPVSAPAAPIAPPLPPPPTTPTPSRPSAPSAPDAPLDRSDEIASRSLIIPTI